ncbi:MAG: hypothetical protein ACLTMP_08495 [Eggerthella lenta]
MDTKAIEELIAIMDKAELTALRVDDGETKSNWSATTACFVHLHSRPISVCYWQIELRVRAVEDADESPSVVAPGIIISRSLRRRSP